MAPPPITSTLPFGPIWSSSLRAAVSARGLPPLTRPDKATANRDRRRLMGDRPALSSKARRCRIEASKSMSTGCPWTTG
jgi:hypothetical protein